MVLQKTVVNNSLRLSSIQTDKFKTALLTLTMYMPLTEHDYLLGMVLTGVMRRGTFKYPSLAHINKRLDELYASNIDIRSNACGDMLAFSVSADLLDGRFSIDGTDILSGVCEIMSEVLFRPCTENGLFPQNSVRAEKNVVRDALLSEKSDTRAYAETRLKELMSREGNACFPKLSYLTEAVLSVSSEELTGFYLRLLSQPINAFYVGSEGAETVAEKLCSVLETHRRTCISYIMQPLPTHVCDFLSVKEDMPVSQSKLALGMRTGAVLGNGLDASAVMLNEIFGASPASKLFMNVREKAGLCYYCGSAYSLIGGNLTVTSGIDVKNRERVINEVIAQLDKIREGCISDTELHAARKSIEYGYMQIYDSPYALKRFYTLRETVGVDETADECKARILSVTRDGIAELAQSIVYDTCFFISGTLSDEKTEDYDCE